MNMAEIEDSGKGKGKGLHLRNTGETELAEFGNKPQKSSE